MSISLGSLRIDLNNPATIDAAISALGQIQKRIDTALQDCVTDLTAKGKAAAEIRLGGAVQFDDGPDNANIAINCKVENGVGHVFTNDDDAVYLEYGTGIVGKVVSHPGIDSGESHPPVMHYTMPNGVERTYTKYDTYEHGTDGWTFKKNGRTIRTVGIPGQAFMYQALKDLEDIAPLVMADHLKKE